MDNLVQVESDPRAQLVRAPRDLDILWAEYMEGIGTNKAARSFTQAERGRVKHKFCRRKVFWGLIARFVNSGVNHQVAIDRVYAAYGQGLSVSAILRRLKADIRNGELPQSLQIG